ncbi:hypothetical protein [Leucobacter chironomi]|uniref:hypothetical protein n=1 Tax=Leucobacter chironomi TaxID=491918 RepID=UPI000429870B|nr:hypothetical protein [Leucobacter chironomi]
MSIGKYVTNPGVIGAAAGALSTARRTQSMRRDWRRLLVWGVWLAGLALAIATVAMQEQDTEYEVEHEAAKQAEKRRKKQR